MREQEQNANFTFYTDLRRANEWGKVKNEKQNVDKHVKNTGKARTTTTVKNEVVSSALGCNKKRSHSNTTSFQTKSLRFWAAQMQKFFLHSQHAHQNISLHCEWNKMCDGPISYETKLKLLQRQQRAHFIHQSRLWLLSLWRNATQSIHKHTIFTESESESEVINSTVTMVTLIRYTRTVMQIYSVFIFQKVHKTQGECKTFAFENELIHQFGEVNGSIHLTK